MSVPGGVTPIRKPPPSEKPKSAPTGVDLLAVDYPPQHRRRWALVFAEIKANPGQWFYLGLLNGGIVQGWQQRPWWDKRIEIAYRTTNHEGERKPEGPGNKGKSWVYVRFNEKGY